MSLLLRCIGGQRAVGGRFGLATLASAVVPPPLWFHRASGSADALMHGLTGQPDGVGIAPRGAGHCWGGAWIAQRRELAVLAAVAFLAAEARGRMEIAGQPTSTIVSLVEVVDVVLWPVGMLIWGVAAMFVVELVRDMASLVWSAGLLRASELARVGRARSPAACSVASANRVALERDGGAVRGWHCQRSDARRGCDEPSGPGSRRAWHVPRGVSCSCGGAAAGPERATDDLCLPGPVPTPHWICSTALCGC